MNRTSWYKKITILDAIAACAVVSMVAAILVPIHHRMTERGEVRTCLDNQKALGLALTLYVQDYDEKYPSGSYGSHGVGWASQTYIYVKRTDVYHCPADPTAATLCNGVAVRPVSYAYNSNLPVVSLQAANDPDRTVLLFEVSGINAEVYMPDESGCHVPGNLSATGSGADGILYSGPNDEAAGTYATGDMGGRGNIVPAVGRHNGRPNFLMMDAHVARVPGSSISDGVTAATPTSPQTPGTAGAAEGTAVKMFPFTFSYN